MTETPVARMPRRTIAFLAVAPLPELDLFGPFEIFKTANRLRPAYDIVVLSAGDSRELACAGGLSVTATASFRDFDRPIDTLIVLAEVKRSVDLTPDLRDWIVRQAASARRVCSVCTGAFVLAEAGVLDGKRATTHWLYEKAFRKRFPRIDLDIASIWTRDGKVYTSAGVSTGIDLALALVEEDCGYRTALNIAKGLVLFLRRTGSQKQFSPLIGDATDVESRLRDLPAWLIDHITEDLSVEAMAEARGMSPRNFSRQFTTAFGTGPADYVRRMRIDAAARHLEDAVLSWKEIAVRCGSDAEALRRAFVRHMGISPQAYATRYTAGRAEAAHGVTPRGL